MGAAHLAQRSKRARACLAVGLLAPLAVVVPTSTALAAPEQPCVTLTTPPAGIVGKSVISGDGATLAMASHGPEAVRVITRSSGAVRFSLTDSAPITPLALDNDAEFLVFFSTNKDLVGDDSNKTGDVFVATLATGAIERVSVGTGGLQGGLTNSALGTTAPSTAGISNDGRIVVFSSFLNGLTPSDHDSTEDVFVRDRTSNITTHPVQDWTFGGHDIRISPDGRTIIYREWADANPSHTWMEFVDRQTGGNWAPPWIGEFWPLDNARVAIVSAEPLVGGPVESNIDAFFADLTTGNVIGVTPPYVAASPFGGASADGRWWLFGNTVYDATANMTYRPITNDGRSYGPLTISSDGQWILGTDVANQAAIAINGRAPSAATFEPAPIVGGTVAATAWGDLRVGDVINAGANISVGPPTSATLLPYVTISFNASTSAVPGTRPVQVDRPGICSRTLDVPLTVRSDAAQISGDVYQQLYPGLVTTINVAAANVAPGAVFSAGQGITVMSASVMVDRVDLTITVDANAVPGPRSLTVTNPSGVTATIAYWADVYPPDYYSVPTPTIDLMLSNVVHTGEETPVLLIGTGFLPWTWLRVAPQLELLRAEVIDSETIFAVVRSHATIDDLGEISATNGRVRTSMPYAGITTRTGEGEFHPITPTRFLDTREPAPHPMTPASTIDVHVTGRDGVPSTGVAAVVMNVTAVDATNATYLTVYPSGQTQPDASSVNVASSDAVPNLVTAKVGSGGNVSIFNYDGDVNVVVDVVGWYSANGAVSAAGPGAAYFPLSPERILDTRNTIGGRNGHSLGAGETMRLKIAEPDDGVTAAALNVTIASPSEGTFLSVWPSDKPLPRASNLNARKGQSIPNMVLTPVAPDGTISIYNYAGNAHVVVDLLGFYDDGSVPTLHGVLRSVAPTRILDTRKGLGAPKAPVDANKTLNVRIYGSAGVPWGATAVVLNVTGTEATAGTFLTVFPSDEDRPNASNINLDRGGTAPNMVVVPIALDGTISIYNYAGSTHVIADVVGYYT